MPLTYNGASFTVVDSAEIRAERHDWFEVSGDATAEYRVTELDQDDPKGRYRWRVEDDVLMVQKKQTIVGDTWKTYIQIDKDGVTLDALNDDQSTLLQVMLMYMQEIREMLELALESEDQVG